eukprot:TRINITY_DN2422_c0_g1_i1.p1 TRINITY_DN2422_c0_g1~~TRINITY_DN2422_c0_g1_i1.p1  ORF type:complete len:341 (-),score=23.14 TRINITY_DN2422_c0_g1_i1:43-1065(-)
MKLNNLFVLLIVVLSTQVAFSKKSKPTRAVSTPVHYEPKKLHTLQKLSEKNSVVELGQKDYLELVAQGPRQYSIILTFTSETSYLDCSTCREMAPLLDEASKIYREFINGNYSRANLFFVKLELAKNAELFNKLKTNLRGVPHVRHVPPTSKKSKNFAWSQKEVYPLYTDRIKIEELTKWIQQRTNIMLLKEPSKVNIYTRYYPALIALVVLYLSCKFIPGLSNMFKKPMFWFIISSGIWAIMLSGIVYNMIHQPPLFYTHQGNRMFIYPSFRAQFVLEGFIISGLMLVALLGYIISTSYAPSLKGNWKIRFSFLIGAAMFTIPYYTVFSIYRVKMGMGF